MSEDRKRLRIETEAIVIGYAMSRLDTEYLSARGYGSWEQAFADAAQALAVPSTSFKNLRDEFDPVHSNARRGWHRRELRPNRQRVLDELNEASDEALLELVNRILKREEAATEAAIDSLAVVNRVAHNVAERLLTGRRAEEYFLLHTNRLVAVPPPQIIDLRNAACGFDFGVQDKPEWAIEIKGLKEMQGGILFTDREWMEAKSRQENYWLIVIGNLKAEPVPRIIHNPHACLTAQSAYRQSLTIEWRSVVSVA